MATNAESPLLEEYVIDAVDHGELPARRSNTGRWSAAWFIIGVEVAERFAYYGIASNLISYLTGPLGLSTAVAASNVNAWSGISCLLPVLGAFVADAFLGRYPTIIIASLVYVLLTSMSGLALTLSACLVPISTPSKHIARVMSSSPSSLLNLLFFFSLYLVAVGQSGHKPCVQAFGADQFDETDPKERRERSSFFNWWYLSMCAGVSLAILVVVYIQEAVSWALGFGIPCVFMVMSLVLFVLGRRKYRYVRRRQEEEINPFTRVGRALLAPSACSASDVEDATALVRLIPVWLTTLTYAVPYAQYMTFFTKQGVTMERTIVPGVEIPPASLQILMGLLIVIFVPIYDRVMVPIARSLNKDPCGITMLKRIGTGMALSSLTMVVAAMPSPHRAEKHRSRALLEFIRVGSLLSSLLISVIGLATGGDGGNSWFNSNLNRAHLDYFYWLLVVISALGFFAFLIISRSYIYRRVDGV
ncbi:hypothetical protein Bca52824_024707 [Brassica carinata]|uniref:Uncharacterized protein n=1 Tax=Brassica carinata TaxID=52824 RepID=A0A8X8AUY0_BRACI|nr:hypothetical protein Bca52824_024707 [Brassica carinata]